MSIRIRRTAFTPLGQRGIALPVALLALVALTLMVITVMVTSGTEGAIARAHVDGTQSLYDAEAGLTRYVMQKAAAQGNFSTGDTTYTLAGTGRTVQIRAARLASRLLNDSSTYSTWALTAEAVRNNTPSGRAITALVFQRRPSASLNLNIQSAITLGGDLDVNGNAFTVNGRYSGCGVNGGVQGVQMADSSKISVSGNESKYNNFTGFENGGNTTGRAAIDSTSLTRSQLASQVLGNKSVAQIADLLPDGKKWCMSTTTCRFKSGSPATNRPVWSGVMPTGDSVAVIDGNGGSVEVMSGAGLLIIVNGNLLMKGNDAFTGIIIVEGNFTLSGTPTVTGALISLAMNGQNEIIQDESAIANGHVTVQFNKCMVDAAARAFSNQAVPGTTTSTTFAWTELVR